MFLKEGDIHQEKDENISIGFRKMKVASDLRESSFSGILVMKAKFKWMEEKENRDPLGYDETKD